ncbi:MAG: response regulator transcription factor [Phycisphaerae bacterium]|nr:response regulator transcription factor [Phycisphaerae bacterium]
MAKQHVLVVDDEENIQELVRYNLAKNGYQVSCVGSGEDALKAARLKMPDLILLDLMLPRIDGLQVCRELKGDAKTRTIPVVMLTAKGEEADIVAGLELGADDYVTKPFSPRVLLARVRAVLRRKAGEQPDEAEVVVGGPITVHPGRHEVLVAGQPVEMTHTEFRILHLLVRQPGWVFTRVQIVEGAQGPDVIVTDRSVDVHMVSLRRKLGQAGDLIETVRGVGYRFKDE